MALLQHNQIKAHIQAEFVPHIDCSDVRTEDLENCQLSRAVSAFSLTYITDIEKTSACQSIVDGFGDNGIDAIYCDANERTLYLVQSKWSNDHNGSVDNGSVLKFLQGAKDLLNSRFEKFNDKVKSRRIEIESALNTATRVLLIISYSGASAFSEENKRSVSDFLDSVDENRELVDYLVINQSALHKHIVAGVAGAAITDRLQLFNWGALESNITAYYGQIAASDLALLQERHGHKLFSKNIRIFLGSDSSVNRNMMNTLEQEPDLFWYYNNGVSALADSINRLAIGGATRDAGVFECTGLTIVNGAQTVGSISLAYKAFAKQVEDARVPIRIISLEGAPEDFAREVTRNNNNQNRIDTKNFVALDPNQERLRTEFLVDGIDYEYREGEFERTHPQTLSLTDATIALACTAKNVDLSTQAKREVGKLWDDIERPPYKFLFHSGITSRMIWSRYRAVTEIEKALLNYKQGKTGRFSSALTHGNRFITHCVFWKTYSKHPSAEEELVLGDDLRKNVESICIKLEEVLEGHYAENYLASLFKNATKCRDIKEKIFTSDSSGVGLDPTPAG